MNGGEVGEGLKVGAAGSGSPALMLVGLITEPIGRLIVRPSSQSPEFKAKTEKALADSMHFIMFFDFKMSVQPSMTPEQVAEAAKAYCTEMQRKIDAKEPIVLHRKAARKMVPRIDDYIQGDGETFQYLLTKDPFPRGCLQTLDPSGQAWVSQKKLKMEGDVVD